MSNKAQLYIQKGKAVLTPSGLRCQGKRPKSPEQPCGKLVVKPNSRGLIAGDFKCERCGQEICVDAQVI